MTWVDRVMQMVKDYAMKQGAHALMKEGKARDDMAVEAALAYIAIQSYLEAAKPAQVPPEGLAQ